jgi:hypothetical protein
MTTKSSLEILSRLAPRRAFLKYKTYAECRFRELELSRILGREVDPNLEYGLAKANLRVAKLEELLAARTAPAPAAATVTTTPPAPAAPVVTTQGNVRSASEYLGMTGDARAEFAASGGKLSRDAFDTLTSRQKSDFARHGGTISFDTPNGLPRAAAPAVNSTPDNPAPFSGTGKLLSRAAVEALDPRQRMEFFRGGGQIVNL